MTDATVAHVRECYGVGEPFDASSFGPNTGDGRSACRHCGERNVGSGHAKVCRTRRRRGPDFDRQWWGSVDRSDGDTHWEAEQSVAKLLGLDIEGLNPEGQTASMRELEDEYGEDFHNGYWNFLNADDPDD